MPIMLEQDGAPGARSCGRLRERGIQTSIFYPAIHRFSAYRERFPEVSLPRHRARRAHRADAAAFPHMTDDDQDRVVDGARRGAWPDRERLARAPARPTSASPSERRRRPVLDCLRESGWLTMGPRTQAFEQALAELRRIAARA